MNTWSESWNDTPIARRIDLIEVMDIVRGLVFVGTVLAAWISLHPFQDLGDAQIVEITTGNELPTYVTFGGLAVLTIMLAMRNDGRGLATLLTPTYVLFGGWSFLTTVLSLDPDTSIRRFSLTVCVIAVTAALMLLPKSQHELMRWISTAALTLLAICYMAVFLTPNLAIHLATDVAEPNLAGNWRGSFGHKNEAAAIMVMLIFLGIYILRAGARISGAMTIGLATIFLVETGGKTSMVLTCLVMILTLMLLLVRAFWIRATIALLPLLAFNLLSVGTVMSDSLASLAQLLPFDSTFTGRTDIWLFAFEALKARLVTGYGFFAFWGSPTLKGMQDKEWVTTAAHSHNGYLDTALGMGLPGMTLLIAALVIKPLRDFHRADLGGNNGPLVTALLQIWLFMVYLSSMESVFLDRADPLWFTFLLAVFGLHYLARFRAK